jgi:hypothetical protein
MLHQQFASIYQRLALGLDDKRRRVNPSALVNLSFAEGSKCSVQDHAIMLRQPGAGHRNARCSRDKPRTAMFVVTVSYITPPCQQSLEMKLGHYCTAVKSHTCQRHTTQTAQSNFKPGKAACPLPTAGYLNVIHLPIVAQQKFLTNEMCHANCHCVL